jgi:hypothetical protein
MDAFASSAVKSFEVNPNGLTHPSLPKRFFHRRRWGVKANWKSPCAGLQQAKGYSSLLDLKIAYSINFTA